MVKEISKDFLSDSNSRQILRLYQSLVDIKEFQYLPGTNKDYNLHNAEISTTL